MVVMSVGNSHSLFLSTGVFLISFGYYTGESSLPFLVGFIVKVKGLYASVALTFTISERSTFAFFSLLTVVLLLHLLFLLSYLLCHRLRFLFFFFFFDSSLPLSMWSLLSSLLLLLLLPPSFFLLHVRLVVIFFLQYLSIPFLQTLTNAHHRRLSVAYISIASIQWAPTGATTITAVRVRNQ